MDSIKLARQLRLAVVRNVYLQGNITEEQAKWCLSGPLSPLDSESIVDDSELLCADDALEQIGDWRD